MSTSAPKKNSLSGTEWKRGSIKNEGVENAGVEIVAPEGRGGNAGETSMESKNSRSLTLLSSQALD